MALVRNRVIPGLLLGIGGARLFGKTEVALHQMSAVDAPGFIAAEHYRNAEDEDTVIGIYDWTSNEKRVAWSQSLDPGTREQLLEVLATPMRIVLADHI